MKSLQNCARLTSRPMMRQKGRSYSQLSVRADFQCPYRTLGVTSTTSELQIKKAYRKLALEWHPDVSKHEGADAVFLKLTDAYSFLLGKLNPNEKDPSSKSDSDWDFHDWYWSFRSSRTWAKRQQNETTSTETPPQRKVRGVGQDKIKEQLAGLRHRAAVRSTKNTSSMSSVDLDASYEDEPYERAHSMSSIQQNVEVKECSNSQMESETNPMAHGDAACDGFSTGKTRRKFVAHSGTRSQVMSQLAGLKRKSELSKVTI